MGSTKRLADFKRIYLVFDSDVEGQAGAEKFATRLGMDRCLNVKLPNLFKDRKTDINNYFWDDIKQKKRHTKADFRKLVKEARRFEVRDSVSLRYALKDVQKDLETQQSLKKITSTERKITFYYSRRSQYYGKN